MSQEFVPGDFLVFQLESGYGLLRVLDVEKGDEPVWHVAAIGDLFLDVETAEAALADPSLLAVSIPHVAMSDRAFLGTQVAKMMNVPLKDEDLGAYQQWKDDPDKHVSDRSIRLLLGLR